MPVLAICLHQIFEMVSSSRLSYLHDLEDLLATFLIF